MPLTPSSRVDAGARMAAPPLHASHRFDQFTPQHLSNVKIATRPPPGMRRCGAAVAAPPSASQDKPGKPRRLAAFMQQKHGAKRGYSTPPWKTTPRLPFEVGDPLGDDAAGASVEKVVPGAAEGVFQAREGGDRHAGFAFLEAPAGWSRGGAPSTKFWSL